ncbi:AAA family ATPase, partial [Candidatus Kaiserbacteria bacterium]|nr:AAA family ATPase [Candidatus Kaiserbacteria bacterium]
MYLKELSINGFKSFAKKSELEFSAPITAIVGPNGSGKSNIAESFRFVLGEQSVKSMRGKRGEDLIWGGSDK